MSEHHDVFSDCAFNEQYVRNVPTTISDNEDILNL